MLLALMQANAAVLDIEANCGAIDAAAATAAAAGARLLLTPELFPVGYAPLRLRADLDPAVLAPLRRTLAEIARRNGVALVYSLPAVGAAGQWQITATLVDEDGTELLNYAKVHLFGPDEREAFVPSEAGPRVVDFHGVKTALVICYDVEFPESVRAAAVGGAELVLVPTALGEGFEAVPQLLVRARALENHVTVAYANHSGTEDGCAFLGGSVIAGPDGGLLAAAGTGTQLLFADVPVPAPSAQDVAYLADLRPGTYRSWNG
ncbi:MULTISPECIES: nitrilase-related carbon-nitrogen hydrolase [unclassified Arthrobacter]|uniref:nitrilase-related carbon-nitrogen hydrolase n=1 Tax=unclassified Arthrobacter TaxID=235627 RepID=UPI002DFCA2E6|nr:MULTISPECIES: nitrilase-related carbon-nitrogen hydrolase [unclassified Arthrobacter]MEC5190267.1 putative amidohydrolase [Arthrobacter sp. MP_M4]MEC5202640.1 putative amidohydrolase [Arthrobacter sp. MP_M7]